MKKKYRLKKKRIVSIIIIMVFLFSFFYMGIKNYSKNSNYKSNYKFDKEYFLCKNCNVMYFQTDFTPEIGYIFQYANDKNIDYLGELLTKNDYYVSILKNNFILKNKFAYLIEDTTLERFEKEYLNLQKLKLLKNTIIILETKNLISIKLPNLTENIFIDKKITSKDLIATLEEILDLKDKTPILKQKGNSFLDVIAKNTNYNSSIKLS